MFVPDASFNPAATARSAPRSPTPAETVLAASIAMTSLALGFTAAAYGAALGAAGFQPRR